MRMATMILICVFCVVSVASDIPPQAPPLDARVTALEARLTTVEARLGIVPSVASEGLKTQARASTTTYQTVCENGVCRRVPVTTYQPVSEDQVTTFSSGEEAWIPMKRGLFGKLKPKKR